MVLYSQLLQLVFALLCEQLYFYFYAKNKKLQITVFVGLNEKVHVV